MADVAHPTPDLGEESLIILQSLLCLLREKNILSRADMEELSQKMEQRAAGMVDGPLSCCPESAKAASADMERISRYIGQRYGGKHARSVPMRPLA
jgi:hypothetical protein